MHQEIVDKLFSIYKEKGYVGEDSVFDALLENNLPLDEINILCNTLLSMGVLIKSEDLDDVEVIYDRSQTDYDKLFDEVISIDYTLKQIIDEIREIRPPQHREWQNLMISAQNGNAYSRDRVILMYLRLVVKIAMWHYKKYGILLADAVQNGCIGLVVALEKYEIGRHNNFSQHASLWIRQHIMREAEPANSFIYFPVHYKDRLFAVYEHYAMHECEMCGKQFLCPNMINEIIQLLNCGWKEARELLNYLIPMDSIDEIIESNEAFFIDGEEFAEQMVEDCTRQELITTTDNMLKTLTSREEKVLKLRFGFCNNNEMTLEEVGRVFNVTRERIRQIEAKAIRKLRHPKRTDKLKYFL